LISVKETNKKWEIRMGRRKKRHDRNIYLETALSRSRRILVFSLLLAVAETNPSAAERYYVPRIVPL
jgi:hypothetical protein